MDKILTDAELKAMVAYDVAVFRERAATMSGYADKQRDLAPVPTVIIRDEMMDGAK